MVDRVYKLDEVPDAIAYQAEWHARGKIVVSIIPGGIGQPGA